MSLAGPRPFSLRSTAYGNTIARDLQFNRLFIFKLARRSIISSETKLVSIELKLD
jgi:hypothetical protein